MEDKFTAAWKKKFSRHHQEIEGCDKLAFANGFSVLFMVVWLLFCIPVAFITTVGKQYVFGFNKQTNTLHLFVRSIWGGASDKLLSFPVSEIQNLEITDRLVKFNDKEGQEYKLHSVGMGNARKNFPLISAELKG